MNVGLMRIAGYCGGGVGKASDANVEVERNEPNMRK